MLCQIMCCQPIKICRRLGGRFARIPQPGIALLEAWERAAKLWPGGQNGTRLWIFGFWPFLAFGRFWFLAVWRLAVFGFWLFVVWRLFAFRPCLTFGLLLVCVWFCVPCVRFFVFGLVLFSCVCVYHLFDLIRFCFSECDRTTPLIAMRLLSLLVLLLLLPSPRTSCERDAQRIKQNVRRFACVEVRCVPLKGCNNSHKHSNCKQSLLDPKTV